MTKEEYIKQTIEIFTGYCHEDILPILAERQYHQVMKKAEEDVRNGFVELIHMARHNIQPNN